MERVIGIEPTSSAWKAEALPLDDTRLLFYWGDLGAALNSPLSDADDPSRTDFHCSSGSRYDRIGDKW